MAKILFIQEIYFPFQSVSKLSTYLKRAGHCTALFIGGSDAAAEKIKSIKPDLIAFSVLTPYRRHALETAAAIKRAGINTPVIAGGYDISFLPQILEYSDFDIICVGEGEEALAELCRRLDSSEDYADIPNLWVKKDGTIARNKINPWRTDLDSLPFEDRDIYLDYDGYFSIVPFTQVLAGRGCPHSCGYCFNGRYREIYGEEGHHGYCKLRSVYNLIEELIVLKTKYGARYIFFNDSTLTYNKKWLLAFLAEYKKKISLPFSINGEFSEIDEEIAAALRGTGCCFLLRLAIETGDQDFRMNVLDKKLTDETIRRGAKILQKYNIRYSIAMMFGLPGETLDISWKTVRLAREISASNTVHAVNIFKPFPGLKVTDYGVKIGQYQKSEISARDLPDILKKRETQKGGQLKYDEIPMGSPMSCFYENYRSDEEGRRILNLSRLSHLAIRLGFLEPVIRLLTGLPDNPAYRLIWKATEAFLNIRVHAGATFAFFFKFFLFHRGKKIR